MFHAPPANHPFHNPNVEYAHCRLWQAAKKGEDPNYKTQVWNLSQNVDRTTGAEGRPGVSPCLTPNMVPYITNRGGPLIGPEVLSLQGIPVEDLLLTRESEDQVS